LKYKSNINMSKSISKKSTKSIYREFATKDASKRPKRAHSTRATKAAPASMPAANTTAMPAAAAATAMPAAAAATAMPAAAAASAMSAGKIAVVRAKPTNVKEIKFEELCKLPTNSRICYMLKSTYKDKATGQIKNVKCRSAFLKYIKIIRPKTGPVGISAIVKSGKRDFYLFSANVTLIGLFDDTAIVRAKSLSHAGVVDAAQYVFGSNKNVEPRAPLVDKKKIRRPKSLI
jgi:hypothetical protein